jgi:hypothetical protein
MVTSPPNSSLWVSFLSVSYFVEGLHGAADSSDPSSSATDDRQSLPPQCHLSSPLPLRCQHRPRYLHLPFIDLELSSGPPELEKHEYQHLTTSSPVVAVTPAPPVRNPPPLIGPLLPCTIATTTLPGVLPSPHSYSRRPSCSTSSPSASP